MKKVAIIEDNAEINNLIRKILIADNYLSTQFFNGSEVIKQLAEIALYDVILLDVMLPVVNGFSIYEEIRKNYPQSLDRVLFLTARSDKETLSFFEKNQCKYIIKPFDPYEFLNILKGFFSKEL